MHPNAAFAITEEANQEIQAALAQKYYLVRQGSLGEIFRCSRCKGKHSYMTLMCVERPYSGLIQGLIAFYKVLGDPKAYVRMSPSEQRRVDAVGDVVRPLMGIPDLSAAHPTLARSAQVQDSDLLVGSVALGIMVEIDQGRAQKLQDKINGRGIKPRLALPGLRP